MIAPVPVHCLSITFCKLLVVRLSGNASTVLPAMSVTVGSIVFVGQVTIISLFVIFFHCSINNSHVFWDNRINFILPALSCIVNKKQIKPLSFIHTALLFLVHTKIFNHLHINPK